MTANRDSPPTRTGQNNQRGGAAFFFFLRPSVGSGGVVLVSGRGLGIQRTKGAELLSFFFFSSWRVFCATPSPTGRRHRVMSLHAPARDRATKRATSDPLTAGPNERTRNNVMRFQVERGVSRRPAAIPQQPSRAQSYTGNFSRRSKRPSLSFPSLPFSFSLPLLLKT